MSVFRLELRARYVGGTLGLHTARGDRVMTVPLDRLDPVDALDLMEMGFGDPGRIEGLPLDALDEALDREGWTRITDWAVDGAGTTWSTVERS
ncbi:hypothetical protein [Kineococcus rhizosphaerae]|uniref:Uncharacterized protein n=1 Tax=Kineococcus rhizosphaerae TaxID=559628 RepID=A0A2T0QNE1_9ACTN|nr:hypothetical protein [Kineococcus rhizosphaerae]PRY06098.1 hypothetical protein CLV37_13513 [Kineococcus rhizosphaerae]